MAGGLSEPAAQRGFHAAAKYWQRKGRECPTWWYSRCVMRDDGQDKLSVPCAMFARCMYAAQREDFTAEQLEVLDAWAHNRVCLIGYSPAWDFADHDLPFAF